MLQTIKGAIMMNFKNFLTKKNILIFAVGLMVIVLVTLICFLVVNMQTKKTLVSAIDTSWNSSKIDDQPTFLEELDKLSSYKINSVKREKSTYLINATVTAPDLGGQLAQLDSSELQQTKVPEDINAFLCEQIKKSQIKKTDVEIYAYKINGEYHISFSDAFADAMSGNLYKYSKDTFIELLQKYDGGELK